MDFDDYYTDKRNHHGQYREQSYNDGSRYRPGSHNSTHGYYDQLKWTGILDKVRNNRKLKLLVALAGALLVIIAGIVLIALLPLIMQLVNYISQNGLQGLLDSITGFLDKLWKGSEK